MDFVFPLFIMDVDRSHELLVMWSLFMLIRMGFCVRRLTEFEGRAGRSVW